jgi:hypothetical protein
MMPGNVISAGKTLGGYDFYSYKYGKQHYIIAGCRHFTLSQAEKHWDTAHSDNLLLQKDIQIKLEYIKSRIAAE